MTSRKPAKSRSVRLPDPGATYSELDRFFDRHEGPELVEQGIMELDPDRADLDRMLRAYWKQPHTRQLNIRIPATAKRLIERLAKRKTVEVSTLVRVWVIEGMRREARETVGRRPA